MTSTLPGLEFSTPSKKSATPKTTTTPKTPKTQVPEEWKKPRNRIKLSFNSREAFKHILEDDEFLKLLKTDSFVEVLGEEYVAHLHFFQKHRVQTIHIRFEKKMKDLNVEFDAAIDTAPSWDTFKEDNELTQKLLLLKKETDNVKELKEVESLEPVWDLEEIKKLKEPEDLEEVKNVDVQEDNALKRKSDKMTNPEEELSSTGHKEVKMNQDSSFEEPSTDHKQLMNQSSSFKESISGKKVYCANCIELKQENIELNQENVKLHQKVDFLMSLLKVWKPKKQKTKGYSEDPAISSSSPKSPKESDDESKESQKSPFVIRRVFLEDLLE